MSTKQPHSITGQLPSMSESESVRPVVQAIRPVSDDLNSRSARFQAELDSIIRRPVTAPECREALLDALVRHRSLVAGAWYIVEGANAKLDASRLQGPVFERDEIRKWLALLAARAIAEQRNLVVPSPTVRNMQAICIPLNLAQPASSDRPAQGKEPPPQGLTLTILITDGQAQNLESELLAAQCVIRSWVVWNALTGELAANTRMIGTSAVLELTGLVTTAEDLNAAAHTLTNTLQTHMKCRLVALGLVVPNRSIVTLTSLSGVTDTDTHSSQVQLLTAAMNEVVLRGSMTTYPSFGHSSNHLCLAHKRLSEVFGVEAVVSMPLRDEDDKIIGVLLCGGTARQLLNDSPIQFLTACSVPVGQALTVARRVDGGWIKRADRKFSAFLKTHEGVVILAVLTVLLATCFLPWTYYIRCRCRIEPVVRQFSLSPYDGSLEETFVEPGDIVKQGDLLARMNGRELNWELAGITAETERASKERDTNMAQLKAVDSLMSALEVEKLSAREQLLKHRQSELEIKSPVDGVVLAGSLDQRQNYPVKAGEKLYEIAPLNPLRIDVAIPAAELPHIREGMPVEVRVDGDLSVPLAGIIERIRPQSEIRDQLNVFIAEVQIQNPDNRLRPGMEGSARISSDRHTLGWNFGHRLWERIVTKLWL